MKQCSERWRGQPRALLLQSIPLSTSHPSLGVWCHPPPSSSTSFSLFQAPYHPFISFPLIPTCCCERRCMIYEALFLPVTEEKERRRETVTKREREKRKEEWWVWRASPRGRRTGAWGGDIHHPATHRREVGWDRNMMDPTKIRQDIRQSTRAVYCHTLDTVGCLVIGLISHFSLCASNILSIAHFSSAFLL